MVGENLTKGDIVWTISMYIGVEECEIISLEETENKVKYYKLKSKINYGTSGKPLNELFLTQEEVVTEQKRKEQESYDKKFNKINSLEALLKFMIDQMYTGEYTDYTAIKVAKDKAKEFGYNLSE